MSHAPTTEEVTVKELTSVLQSRGYLPVASPPPIKLDQPDQAKLDEIVAAIKAMPTHRRGRVKKKDVMQLIFRITDTKDDAS